MKFKRAAKYGFCAGVRIADKKVKKFARLGGRDGSILGQVVHNERVVDEMADLGVPTIEALAEAGGGTVVFSAHGVPPSFHDDARRAGLKILDTTCPFVYDIHDEADAAVAAGTHLVFIGKPDHREVIGYTHDRDPATYHVLTTVDEAREIDWGRYPAVKVLYQTTLNADDYEDVVGYIESRTARVSRADTICYATKENQDAVRELGTDPEVDVILVIGGRRSANTRHLWEIGRRFKPTYLVHDIGDLDPEWFAAAATVGITAGASTPDYMIDEVEAAVSSLAAAPV
ncbi:MAG: 4-hydroxy-3-methylbut-2-enyl diphosphate reductase [Acidobacteriota bacterium]|nr:4-hydroxy-3-methylbut-2-enyl diphosphate reductase [Acidobacteriota bacterium]MDH3522052.1 4-hydroxy-3-methylbut-2-enyl diphosphate reductase [Acidobacteriota bacterium]